MADTWCTIESDPGVFTELIESIGVKGVQGNLSQADYRGVQPVGASSFLMVEELYSFDEASFARLQPVYGLIFLFKWSGEKDDRPAANAGDHPGLFFAHQVIQNACATQAILSVLLNISDKVELGETLDTFLCFTRLFTPDMKGLAISNDEKIRSTHNSFARQEPFLSDTRDDSAKEKEAFHFIAYLPHGGKVYELDGLKPGPIVLGEANDNWLDIATPAIQERIARYSTSEIRFNLMAIVKNRRQVAEEKKALHERHITCIEAAIAGEPGQGKRASSEVNLSPEFGLAMGLEALASQRDNERMAVADCAATIQEEKMKFKAWRAENVRRKHNYVPFAVNLLKLLADKGELEGLLKAAKEAKTTKSS